MLLNLLIDEWLIKYKLEKEKYDVTINSMRQ